VLVAKDIFNGKESFIFFVLSKEQRGSEGVNALCSKLLFIILKWCVQGVCKVLHKTLICAIF